ncbi:hypothetical protein D3C83_78520 [compost metagenome]
MCFLVLQVRDEIAVLETQPQGLVDSSMYAFSDRQHGQQKNSAHPGHRIMNIIQRENKAYEDWQQRKQREQREHRKHRSEQRH